MKKLLLILTFLSQSAIFATDKVNFNISAGLGYSNMMSTNIKSLFKANGVEEPSKAMAAFSFRGGIALHQRHFIAADLQVAAKSDDEGRNYVGYKNSLITLGYGFDFIENTAHNLIIWLNGGTTIERVQVFGPSQSTKWAEVGGIVMPAIEYDFRIYNYIRMSVNAAYLAKFARSNDFKGDDLKIKTKDEDFRFTLRVNLSDMF